MIRKRKILYISMSFPDRKANDAGTRNLSYYFYGLADDKDNEITLLSLIEDDQLPQIKQLPDNVGYYPVRNEENIIRRYIGYLRSIRSKVDPAYPYGNVLSYEKYRIIDKICRNLKSEGYDPDLVILDWTYILLFIEKIKSYFPKAKYISSEQDISYQSLEREYRNDGRLYSRIRYETMKNNEIHCLKECDLVFVYNHKDEKLLNEEGIDNIVVLSPYYEKRNILYRGNRKNILFYGAMNRKENYTAAVWFIDNVMPLLKDYEVKFIVAGNRPPKFLKDLESSNISIAGYVEDISEYFSEAMCFVVPLLYGAGIKIKILEAMSAGIPVLTNDIGIEGIEGVEYYHCEKPEDYADVIIRMIKDGYDRTDLSENSRQSVHENYDYERSLIVFLNSIYSLIN